MILSFSDDATKSVFDDLAPPDLPPSIVNTARRKLIHGKRAITTDTGLRLDRYFGLSEGYWLRIQLDCNIRITKRRLVRQISHIKPRELVAA